MASPEGSDETTTVVVDVNEPEQLRLLALYHDDTDTWKEHQLDAADVVVNGVGFERKTPSDFASSMMEDRLDEQVRKLQDGFEEARILLEGSFDDFDDLSHTRLTSQSARGKAASIDMRHGVPVIPTGGEPGNDDAMELLVDYAIRLGRKATEDPTSGYLPSSVVGSDEPLGKRLWGCYEGVGPTRAGDLYETVDSPVTLAVSAHILGADGTAETPADAMLARLVDIDGIGQKTAQRLVSAILSGEDVGHSVEPGAASDGAHAGLTDSEGDGNA